MRKEQQCAIKKFKAITAVMLSAVVVLCTLLTGCGAKNDKSDGKLRIISTIFPYYDFARTIGGEKADVTMLLRPGAESHSYDPTPQDIINIRKCDIFIYTGGESDEWVKTILESGEKPKKIINAMDCVEAFEEETVEGMDEGNEPEEESGSIEYDEHVWTSPVNALKISRVISSAMQELDKENAPAYKKNMETYGGELAALDNSYKKLVESSSRKTVVFGDRFPFRYLAEEYGLSYYAAFPGCSSETEPSASTVSFLIDKVKTEKIPVVFTIEFSSGKVADTICNASSAKKLMLHSCHNVTSEQMNDGTSYLSLMRDNLVNLKEALN